MSEFRFKQFTVINERSAMKVNTDGVLLGAAVTIDGLPCAAAVAGSSVADATVLSGAVLECLDVGTGTGTVALILAQRFAAAGRTCHISAIDIDEPSVEEARDNFARSPWASSLTVEKSALQEYVAPVRYDLIVSNPPYYDDSLRNPDGRKADARHTASLSFRDIIIFAAENLKDGGRAAFVLPSDVERELLRCARSYGLVPVRVLRIRTTSRKPPRRIVVELWKRPSSCALAAPVGVSAMSAGVSGDASVAGNSVQCLSEELLTMMNEGQYTEEYIALVNEYYFW